MTQFIGSDHLAHDISIPAGGELLVMIEAVELDYLKMRILELSAWCLIPPILSHARRSPCGRCQDRCSTSGSRDRRKDHYCLN